MRKATGWVENNQRPYWIKMNGDSDVINMSAADTERLSVICEIVTALEAEKKAIKAPYIEARKAGGE